MRGTIYTFYSYKGGVGRSMALANIAMHFYKQGFTTLIIDWDLEAPGIERYFENKFNLNLIDIGDRYGLCDMLQTYIANASDPVFEQSKELPYPSIEEYLYKLDSKGETEFLLMPAGRRTDGKPWQDYASFVQTFDWTSFYKDWEGGIYLEWLRERLKTIADVILIDSRTGVTEMGGVATQHLSDAVILFCGANLENMSNTSRMAINFISEPVKKARGNRDLDVLIVPSRIDDADSKGYNNFLKRLEAEFINIPMKALDEGFSIKEMLVPYLSAFSYRETLIVDDQELEKTAHRIFEAYSRVVSNMKLLAKLESSLRAVKSITKKHGAFISFSREDAAIASKVIGYLRSHNIEVEELDYQRSSAELDIVESFLKYSHILIIISAALSRSLMRTIYLAIDNNKIIIPLLIDKNREIPHNLYSFQPIDLQIDFKSGMDKIIAAIIESSSGKPADSLLTAQKDFEKKYVFISYSRRDAEAAIEISSFLKKSNIPVWIDQQNISIGAQWDIEIEKALDKAEIILALISASSIQSASTLNEWYYSIEKGKKLIPLLLDKNVTLPFRLKRLQYIDLAENFADNLNRLIPQLK